MGSRFGAYRGETIHGTIWFHLDVAGYIKEKTWQPSQKIHTREDGAGKDRKTV